MKFSTQKRFSLAPSARLQCFFTSWKSLFLPSEALLSAPPSPPIFAPSPSPSHHHRHYCRSCSVHMCAFSHDSDSWKGVFLSQLLAGSAASRRLSHAAPPTPGPPVGPGLRTGTFCSSAVLFFCWVFFPFDIFYLLPSFLPLPSCLYVCLSFSLGAFLSSKDADTNTGDRREQILFFCPPHSGTRLADSSKCFHRSGRLMTGTHWSRQRLSLQKRLTLLSAGSED